MCWKFICCCKSLEKKLKKKRKAYVELFDFNNNKISEKINSLIDYSEKNVCILAKIVDNECIMLMAGPLHKKSGNESIYFREILSTECNLKEYSNPKSIVIHIYPNIDPIYSLYSDNSLCILYNLQIWQA